MKYRRILRNFVFSSIGISILLSPAAAALDYNFYSSNNILYYNKDFNTTCDPGGSGAAAPGGTVNPYSISQVKVFAAESVGSTWNLSNTTAEQWFLKQAGARATIAKYNLTSSNISDITSAIKAEKVSPVFFYLYAVNEGGGAGGFINHYGGDVSGGGPANASRDAKYIASQSRKNGQKPATGGGEPANMPTAEAQKILDALPAGSIGMVYIPATSAVTAELEDLSGKTGSWSGKFNKPLSSSMQNIEKMGGDPMNGGASVASDSCANGVTGKGMAKGISWAKMIANNNGYGYDQPGRATGWAKWQSSPNCTNQCGSFDCSSFISAILTVAGYYETNPEFAANEGSEGKSLKQAGFKKIASSATSSQGLKPGDILLKNGAHTEMYIGDNKNVSASHNENHGISGGQVGDQTGDEISIKPFYNDNWTAVYRASGS